MSNNEEIILTNKKKKDKKEKKQKLTKEEKKAKKAEKKAKKEANPEKYYKVRRLFFGIGKEFLRISWISKNKILYYFLITVFVVVVLAAIFSVITYVITAYVN